MPRMRNAFIVAALGIVCLSCGAVERPRSPALLRMITRPAHAAVYIDDRYAGSGRILEARPIALSPGAHLVTVQARGYFPHDVEIRVAPGLTTARVALRPIPP